MLADARRRFTFVYPVPGYDGCHTWYLIHCGEIAAVATAPRGKNEFAAMKLMLQHWSATSRDRLGRGHGAFPHTLALVASWFRKYRGELDRTFDAENAGRMYYRRLKATG
jgi:excinuclease ABC subunit C